MTNDVRKCLQTKLDSVEEDLLQRNREISRLHAEVDRQAVAVADAHATARRLEGSLEESQQSNATLTAEKADALREVQRTELDRKLQMQQASDKHARAVEALREKHDTEIQGLRSEYEAAEAALNSKIDDITTHAQVLPRTQAHCGSALHSLIVGWYRTIYCCSQHVQDRVGQGCHSL